MQYKENTTVLETSSEVIKFLTIGAVSFSQNYYNAHHLPVQGVGGHIDGFQMPSVLLPEGKHEIKRQLYSRPFTLREAAFLYFGTNGNDSM